MAKTTEQPAAKKSQATNNDGIPMWCVVHKTLGSGTVPAADEEVAKVAFLARHGAIATDHPMTVSPVPVE